MSKPLTSEYINCVSAHQTFDKLCPQMDSIWGVIIVKSVPMENFLWKICAGSTDRWRKNWLPWLFNSLFSRHFSCYYYFFLHFVVKVVLRNSVLHRNMIPKWWQNIVPMVVWSTQLNITVSDEIITQLANARIPFTWWSALFPRQWLICSCRLACNEQKRRKKLDLFL